jgi:hypothetical protein
LEGNLPRRAAGELARLTASSQRPARPGRPFHALAEPTLGRAPCSSKAAPAEEGCVLPEPSLEERHALPTATSAKGRHVLPDRRWKSDVGRAHRPSHIFRTTGVFRDGPPDPSRAATLRQALRSCQDGPTSPHRQRRAARTDQIRVRQRLRNRVRNTSSPRRPPAARTTSISVTTSWRRCARWCRSVWPLGVTVTRRVKDQRPQPAAARNPAGRWSYGSRRRRAAKRGLTRPAATRMAEDGEGPAFFTHRRSERWLGASADRAVKPRGVGGSWVRRPRSTHGGLG